MRHRLDGVRLKLIRAEQHLDAIANAFKPYRYGRIQVRSENYTDGGRMLTLHLPKPGLDTSPIIGDCVHNMRSALDYIVSQLVLVGGNMPTHQWFPICLTSKSFRDAVRTKRLEGVSAAAQAIIDGLQPYHRGQGNCDLHPLWILSELANIDKHRFLTVTTVLATSIHMYAPTVGVLVLTGTEMTDGTEFFRDDGVAPVNVDAQGEMFVAFQDAPVSKQNVVVVLKEILDFIRKTVVPGFEPFLD